MYGDKHGSSLELIYLYDLSTKRETQIPTSGGAYSPKIYGNVIVYGNYHNDSLCMFDLSTKKESQIISDNQFSNGNRQACAFYGNKIVWIDGSDSSVIDLYDLSAKKETQISVSGSASYPVIYGNNLVWLDSQNGSSNIYAYDLISHQEINTSDNYQDTSCIVPDVYGNKIVWEHGGSVYTGAISYLPVADFNAITHHWKTSLICPVY